MNHIKLDITLKYNITFDYNILYINIFSLINLHIAFGVGFANLYCSELPDQAWSRFPWERP